MNVLLRASGRRLGIFLLGWTFLLSVCAFNADAQFVRGAILGAVTDDAGAQVPGAQLTLQNNDTNEARTAATDMGGNYSFPALLPGLYRLEVKRSGFKSQVVRRWCAPASESFRSHRG